VLGVLEISVSVVAVLH